MSATTSPRNSQVEDATSIYWGSVWHMQTPLDNIDTGSFVAIEYRSVATTPGATATTVIATFPLDIESIDSGLQTVQLLPSADASKGNPIFANGDKSTVQIEIVLNKRNREIDVKSLYST